MLAAQSGLNAAAAQEQGAQASLAALRAIRARPTALDAAVHRAEGQAAQAEAGVGVARAALAQVQAPARPEAAALAQAKVAQADRNVQTQEERAKTVFRVEITLANPDAALKPGMPADAALLPDRTTQPVLTTPAS